MSEEERVKRKTLLQNYYSLNADNKNEIQMNRNPMDINSAGFDPDMFLSKQIKVPFTNISCNYHIFE